MLRKVKEFDELSLEAVVRLSGGDITLHLVPFDPVRLGDYSEIYFGREDVLSFRVDFERYLALPTFYLARFEEEVELRGVVGFFL